MQRRPGRSRCRPLLPAAADVLRCLVLAVLAAGANAAAAAAPVILDTACGFTQATDPEAFDVSFVNTLELIYQNVTRSGFGAASSGSGNYSVFGLGQCLAYLSPTDCQLCYAQSRVKLPHCLPAEGGRIYLDGCFLRYGADNFTAAASDASDTAVCSNDTAPASPAFRGRGGLAGAQRHCIRTGCEGILLRRVGDAVRRASVRGGAVLEVAERHRVRGMRGERARPGGAAVPSRRRRGVRSQHRLRRQVLDAALLPAGGGGGSSTRHIIIIVFASVLSAMAAVGIVFIWTRMRPRRGNLHDASPPRSSVSGMTSCARRPMISIRSTSWARVAMVQFTRVCCRMAGRSP